MHWDIEVNGEQHKIILEGFNLSGKAKIRVDEELSVYEPVTVQNIGQFFLFEIGSSEFLVRFDPENSRTRLAQDGVYIDTQTPLEQEVIYAFRTKANNQQVGRVREEESHRNRSAFLSFVIFTYVNLGLLIINAPFSFPFSAAVPQYIAGLAFYFYEETPNLYVLLIGLAIALICASVYLLLYFLSKKRLWPIITALVLISLDTLVVLYFSLSDFSYYIIDIIFHGWIIWDFVKLLKSRRR